MNSKFLRLAALIAAAQYTLALPQPITHGTGHYATQIARADSAGVAGAPSGAPLLGSLSGVGSVVAGVVNTVGSVVGGVVPGGLPGGGTVPSGLPVGGTAPGGLVPGSLVPGGILVPGGLPPRGLPVGAPGGLHVTRDILTSDTPTPNPPSQAPGAPALPVKIVSPRGISTSNILQNGGAAGPQEPPKTSNGQAPPEQKGHEEIYHVERAEKKLHAANPQCPPDRPNCDLSASSGSSGSLSESTKTKLRRQVAVSGAGANPEPKAAVSARGSKVTLDKTPLSHKRDNNAEGALPLPLPLPNVPLPIPASGSSDPLTSLVTTVETLLATLRTLLGKLPILSNLPALPATPGAPAPAVGGRSFVDRQVHNADYSSDDGPSGNPPPSPSSAQPQPSATTVPKSTAEA